MTLTPRQICYLEIPAPSVEKASKFYGDVFHWQIEESNLTSQKYSMFDCGANGMSGAFDSSKAVSEGGILIYISVDDIDATLGIILRSGGKIVDKKADIGGGYGFSATFRDPNGNLVGLWEK